MVAFTFKKQIVSKPSDCPSILNDVQDSCGQIAAGLNSLPLSQSVLLTNITLSTAAIAVPHNLGFKIRGFLCVNPTASFAVYEDIIATNPDVRRFVMLRTSAGSYTVNLLVF